MNSPTAKRPPTALALLIRRMPLPRSIVARSTLLIILLATWVGTVGAAGGAWMIQRSEQNRQRAQLEQLLATVESTVSIACYVKDQALAHEIGNGLMNNSILKGVRITTENGLLDAQYRDGEAMRSDAQAISITRRVHSPFKPSETVGEISLYTGNAEITAQAWVYTRFVVWVLALEVSVVALAVALVVFNLITRPIKAISDELHQLEVRTGVHLRVPRGNRQDEIGRLVSDVNALIARLTNLLDTEHRLHMERQASERRLALIFDKVDAGIFEVDRDGLLHSWNPAFVHTLGQPPQPPCLRTMLKGRERQLDELIARCLASGVPSEADFELQAGPAGASKWLELSLTPVSERMLQGFVNDITERKRSVQDAQRLAERDALTGLFNRRGLTLGLENALLRQQREPGQGIAVMQIDLDFFKQVNDSCGHEAGDTVLRHVAQVLNGAVRHTDLVARPGGDEFTVVLIGVDSVGRAEAIARQIIEALNQPIDIGGGAKARIGASIGVAFIGSGEESPRGALRRADEAMYAAKRSGRNTVRFEPAATGPSAPRHSRTA